MKSQQGFSLIEVAIVFVIISFLLAAAIYPLTAQRESTSIAESKQKLEEIQEAIYGFAIAQGRLPCPTRPGDGGISATDVNGNCLSYHGFVPASTLGISGSVNCDGLLLDAWGQPYRYSVTDNDSNGNGFGDFIVAGEITSANIATLNPNLKICRNLAVGCPGSTAVDTLTLSAVAVIYSMGKPHTTNTAQENENAGESTTASTCDLGDYAIANDNFFYGANRGDIYNDILLWISPNILYSRLLQANRI